jgi:hypothetical protein
LHRALLLWEKGKRTELVDLLQESGFGRGEALLPRRPGRLRDPTQREQGEETPGRLPSPAGNASGRR